MKAMAKQKLGETMSGREVRKQARRRAILDAARGLILEAKDRDFSMPILAAKAGVSLVTPYNLFGSKSDILMEIVREDIFERIADIDPLSCEGMTDWIGRLSEALASVYYPNRHFYRRMIMTLAAQESAKGQRAALEFTYRMFDAPLNRLQEAGALAPTVAPAILARHLAHVVSGALQHRLMERGSEALLRQEIETGLLLLLSGLTTEAERPNMLARITILS